MGSGVDCLSQVSPSGSVLSGDRDGGELQVHDRVVRVDFFTNKRYYVGVLLGEIRAITDKCQACWKEFLYWVSVVFSFGAYYVCDRTEVTGDGASTGVRSGSNTPHSPVGSLPHSPHSPERSPSHSPHSPESRESHSGDEGDFTSVESAPQDSDDDDSPSSAPPSPRGLGGDPTSNAVGGVMGERSPRPDPSLYEDPDGRKRVASGATATTERWSGQDSEVGEEEVHGGAGGSEGQVHSDGDLSADNDQNDDKRVSERKALTKADLRRLSKAYPLDQLTTSRWCEDGVDGESLGASVGSDGSRSITPSSESTQRSGDLEGSDTGNASTNEC